MRNPGVTVSEGAFKKAGFLLSIENYRRRTSKIG
jgi:hypothetical protein